MERPQIESIHLKNITLQTPGAKEPLFQNMNFLFPQQGTYWIKSESGAGKSTLLRLLDGLVVPDEGQYLINGHDVANMTFTEFNPYRLQFGLSYDFGGLIHNRTLFQNLSLILEYHKFCGAD